MMILINCLILFLLPVYLIKVPFFDGATLSVLDILLLLALVINFTFLKKDPGFKLKDHWQSNKLLYLLLSFFLITVFFSYLINFDQNNWTNGLGIFKSFLILPILYGISISCLVSGKKLSLEKLFFSFFVSTGIIAIVGYVFSATNRLTFDGRLEIFYNSPNSLAMILSLGILCGFYLFLNTTVAFSKSFYRLFILFFLIAQLFSLYQTHSTAAWISLFIALVLLLFSKKRPFQQKIFLSAILMIILLGFLAILNLNRWLPGIATQSTLPPTSSDSRIVIYRASKEIIKDNPFWGVGLGNFQPVYLEYQAFFLPYPQWAVPHTHNTLLHFWTEGGFLTLFSFFLLLLLPVILLRKNKKEPLVEVLLVSLLAYFFLHGIVDNPLWKNDLAVIFWLVLISLIVFQDQTSSTKVLN